MISNLKASVPAGLGLGPEGLEDVDDFGVVVGVGGPFTGEVLDVGRAAALDPPETRIDQPVAPSAQIQWPIHRWVAVARTGTIAMPRQGGA
jgi:hypothetical protein